MYKAPLVDVIRKSDMRFQHLYADETQVYTAFQITISWTGKNKDRSLRKWYRQLNATELAQNEQK